jgi:hypothetical protein
MMTTTSIGERYQAVIDRMKRSSVAVMEPTSQTPHHWQFAVECWPEELCKVVKLEIAALWVPRA